MRRWAYNSCFLTSAQHSDELTTSRRGRFTCLTLWIRVWVNPRFSVDAADMSLPLAGDKTKKDFPVVLSVAYSLYWFRKTKKTLSNDIKDTGGGNRSWSVQYKKQKCQPLDCNEAYATTQNNNCWYQDFAFDLRFSGILRRVVWYLPTFRDCLTFDNIIECVPKRR